MAGEINGGEGWYVVLDSDESIVFAEQFRNRISRREAETSVAKRLVPGTFYGCGPTMREALQQALERCRKTKHGGQSDASDHPAEG